MYDALSADYDRFVNWQARLSIELPFIIEKLHEADARLVLDAAMGTGMHAIALAQCGFMTAGADISQGMVDRSRDNAQTAGVTVRMEKAGFGNLADVFATASFDGLLCLGNSLPHILSSAELEGTLADFGTILRPGGLLLFQNRNFDSVMAHRERWMEPQAHAEGDTEWLFQRFYDFDPDGLISFQMVTLKRVGRGAWSQSVTTSRIRPLLKDNLISSLKANGFSDIHAFGNMSGVPFDAETSPNLVVTARSDGSDKNGAG